MTSLVALTEVALHKGFHLMSWETRWLLDGGFIFMRLHPKLGSPEQ